MPLKGEDTYKALLKKGFVIAENKSSDHKWVEFWYKGKLTRAKTKFSHSGQELNDYLISQIAKQIYLTKQQFLLFAECQIDQEKYESILKDRNLI